VTFVASEKNLLSAIQKMRKAGNTEDQIRSNLADLGVAPDQAEKLLLLSQPDVQNVLQSEINESVHAQLETEKPKILAQLRAEMQQDEGRISQEIGAAVVAQQQKEQRAFIQKVGLKTAKLEADVQQALDISQRAREKAVLEEQRLNAFQRGIIETPESGHKQHYKPLAIMLFVLGIGIALADVYYIFTNEAATLNSDNVLVIMGGAAIAAIFMYFSSVV
jgi:ribosome-binding ATPase YchF (GTP1/OBG family)